MGFGLGRRELGWTRVRVNWAGLGWALIDKSGGLKLVVAITSM